MFHTRTLEMLGVRAGGIPHPDAGTLSMWATANGVTIPASVMEWTGVGGTALLRRYSNDDHFFLTGQDPISTEHGPALVFNSENQNNFDKAVLLDGGEDPPVVWSWLGVPPWVLHAETFSDCVFAQIFDWQYQLEWDPEDDSADITFTEEVYLRTPPAPAVLGQRFTPLVTTHHTIEEDSWDEHRYWRLPTERLTVMVKNGGHTLINLTGDAGAITAVKAELCDMFADDILDPDDF